MARSAPWRRTCSDLVFWRQTEAQNATIYILRETGPTGFLLKTEGESKPCKAFLGDPHSCTCSQFLKDRDLCKHICWLLLKKFRVPQTDPMSWQKGLVEREINQILRGLVQQMRKKVPTAVNRWRRPLSASSDGREVIEQREIADDDVCPICQDELLLKRLPVTYCKFGCGNSIHIKCMKIWAEHQKTQGETTVKCPFCREDFGPFEMLKHETRNAEGVAPGGRMDRHIGITCQSCHAYPIEGKCYRCNSCADYYLCQNCFNTPIHTQHAFQYRHKRNQRWRPAGRAYGAVLPQAVVDDLVNRELTENDYDLLMQLDSNGQAQGSDIPEDVIQSFPQEKVRETGPLLQPGVQCRVCLRGYQPGQFVRKLPRCKHKFHRECIDNWLLHSRPTCPIDGQVVWDRLTAQLEGNNPQNRPKKRAQQGERNVQQTNTLNLEIPGTGILIRTQESQQRDQFAPNVSRIPNAPRQNGRTERESNRIMNQISRNISVSGTSINQAGDSDHGSEVTVPGGRLLNRTNARRAHFSQRLAQMDDVGIEYEPEHNMSGVVASQIEQENLDPLEHVIAANQTHMEEDAQISPRHERVLQERQQNTGSLFAREGPAQPHNTTAHLLSNAQRLDQYAEIPNVFIDAQNAMNNHSDSVILDSYRTEGSGSNQSAERQNRRFSNESTHSQLIGADVPPDQRLFSLSSSNVQSNGSLPHTGTQLLFDPSQAPVTGHTRGHHSRSTVCKGRPHNNISSAPPAPEGERGRQANRGWSQGQSVTRNRSTSRDRNINGRPMPKEGEQLLERLSVFTDLYLGNSPQTQPATSGIVTATGLPPRPQRKKATNHDAARQRRFENNRRKNNFALEGSAYNDVTLRDLLGS